MPPTKLLNATKQTIKATFAYVYLGHFNACINKWIFLNIYINYTYFTYFRYLHLFACKLRGRNTGNSGANYVDTHMLSFSCGSFLKGQLVDQWQGLLFERFCHDGEFRKELWSILDSAPVEQHAHLRQQLCCSVWLELQLLETTPLPHCHWVAIL